jgi:sphingolipid delta-4 desaturase
LSAAFVAALVAAQLAVASIVGQLAWYSYYGPLNRMCFNVGYHNEHHDLVTVPWPRLPRIRSIAPEFYDSLHAHQSWTKLLLRFLGDRRITLFSRAVRRGAEITSR